MFSSARQKITQKDEQPSKNSERSQHNVRIIICNDDRTDWRSSPVDNSGLCVPSSGEHETLQPGQKGKGGKIPMGQKKREDGGNGVYLIEVTSWLSRNHQQPDMMS